MGLVSRLLGLSSTRSDAPLELQVRLLVAMASADDRITPVEHAELQRFVSRNASSEEHRGALTLLLAELLASPPDVDELLEELAEHAGSRSGELLAWDLVDAAWADDVLDHREQLLLDAVCELFGVDPDEFADEDWRAA